MTACPRKMRLATMADVLALQELIAYSVRGLSLGFYSPEQIEVSLANVFGVDTQLLDDQTYFVIDGDGDGAAAAGGWSGRRTLFGGSHLKRSASDPQLDPATRAYPGVFCASHLRASGVGPATIQSLCARGVRRRLSAFRIDGHIARTTVV